MFDATLDDFRIEACAERAIFVFGGLGDETGEGIGRVLACLRAHGETRFLPGLPGIERRMADVVTIDAHVAALRAAVAADARGRTIVLAGYSVGGTLAYALAAQLAGSGVAVARVVMIDTSAVYPPRPQTLRARIGAGFAAGLAHGLVQVPFLLLLDRDWLEAARRYALAAARAKPGATAADMRMQLLIRRWLMAFARNRFADYAGPVLLLKAAKGRPRITDACLGWSRHARDITMRTLPGTHWSMVDRPETTDALDDALSPRAPVMDQPTISSGAKK